MIRTTHFDRSRQLSFALVVTICCGMIHFQSAVCQADLFVSAASRNSVIRFDDEGNLLGDFVAPGTGGLRDPQGIAFGPDGHLYVSSHAPASGTNAVLRFNGETGEFIDTFASLPDMVWPAEINFYNDHLYVSDFSAGSTGRVSRFDLDGNFVDHFATGLLGADGQSWTANGDLLVSSFNDASIRRYDGETGEFLGDFVDDRAGGLSGPLDNLILPNGELLVSSFGSNSIKRYDAEGNYIDDPITGLIGPQGLAIGPDGILYAGSYSTGTINQYALDDFSFIGTFASAGNSTTNNFVFRAAAVPEAGQVGLLGAIVVAAVSIAYLRRRRTLQPTTCDQQ